MLLTAKEIMTSRHPMLMNLDLNDNRQENLYYILAYFFSVYIFIYF